MQSYCALLIISGLCTLSNSTVVGAQQDSQKRERPSAAIKNGAEKESPQTDQIGAVYVNDELAFPSLDSHGTALLTVGGKDQQWTRVFKDGNEPFFSAKEDGLKPGTYAYKIEYQSNRVTEAKKRRTDSATERRSLLKRRLELMKAGDRMGAKSLLNRANKIRDGLETSGKEHASLFNGSDEDFITKVGQLKVSDDGRIAEFDMKKELKAAAKKRFSRSRNNARRN